MTTGYFDRKYRALSIFLCIILALTQITDISYSITTPDPEENIVERTTDTTTYDLGNGKIQTVYHGSDVRFEGEDGILVDYDPALVEIRNDETEQSQPLSGYAYENKEGDKKQYLPDTISEDTPLIMESEGYHVHMSPAEDTILKNDAEDMEVSLKEEDRPSTYLEEKNIKMNAAAEYDSPSSTVQITYSSLENGIKESLVLKERPENNVFTYILDTGSLVPLEMDDVEEIDRGEGISFVDPETGETVFDISPAWMNDKTENAYSEDIRYEIEPDPSDNGKWLLRMIADKAYLESPERIYPVTIDPTITWTGKTNVKDAYVISGSKYQNTNFYKDSVKKMPAGRNSLGYMHRTFISFNGIKSKLNGKSIASAYMDVYEYGDGAANQKISAYRVTGAWNPATITWNNMPSHSTYLSTITTKKTKYAKARFNLTTYVKGVVKNGYADHGIMINNVTTGAIFADFCGSRFDTAAYRPKLIVTYYEKPAKPTVKIDAKSKTGNGVKITYFGISNTDLKEVRYKFQKRVEGEWVNDSRPEASAGKFGSKTIPINGLGNGYYRVLVWGVNSAGDVGPKGNSDMLIVDTNKPTIGSIRIQTKDKENLADGWTKDNDPTIHVSNIKDNMALVSPYVKYAITKEEDCGMASAAPASSFKNAGKLSLSSQMPYSGYLKLTEADKKLPPGKYVIHVRAEDRVGSTFEKRALYCKDDKAPEGEISVKNSKGAETDILTDTVNIRTDINGTGTDLKETALYLCRTEKGQIKERTDLTGPITKSTTKIFDSTTFENGTYALLIDLEDEVGLKSTVRKDVTIKNRLEAPRISISYHEDRIYCAVQIHEHADRIENFQYAIDDGSWQTKDPEETPVTLIELPNDTDGQHTVRVRGIDKAGFETEETSAEFYCDNTDPTVRISSFKRGKISGTAMDYNLSGWNVSYREKGSDEEYVKAIEGTENIEDGFLGRIDMTDPYFEDGKVYEIKLTAEDKAKNTSSDVFEVTKDPNQIYVSEKPAAFLIRRPSYEVYESHDFTVPITQEGFTVLDGNESGEYVWYIDNEETGRGESISKDLSAYDDGKVHKIAAVRDDEGVRSYSRKITENDIQVEVDTGEVSVEGSFEQEIPLDKGAVSLILDAEDADGLSYSIKAEDGEYVDLIPGEKIYVTDLDAKLAAEDFTLKIQRSQTGDNEGEDLSGARIFFDTLQEESFKVSELAGYLPENLTVNSRLNDRTYVYWDNMLSEGAEDVSYSIYRSKDPDFSISEETLAAENIKAGYFSEMNAGYGCNFYYRITAVKRDAEGNIIEESVPTKVRGGRIIDRGERAKRLGIQDFFEYANFNTPFGKGNVEESQGNLVYSQDDGVFTSGEFETGLTRTYNSRATDTGSFGYGWTNSLDLKLLNMYDEDEKDFTSLVFKDGTGAIAVFEKKNEGYISSEGEYLSLKEEGKTQQITIKKKGHSENREVISAYEMDTSEGVKYFFNGGGQLIYMEEKTGSFILFEYDDNIGLLKRITTEKGLETVFEYNADNPDQSGFNTLLVKKVIFPDGSIREYGYEEKDHGAVTLLRSVKERGKDGKERIHRYSYDEIANSYTLDNITDAMSKSFKISYTDDHKVESITDPEGSGMRFEYEETSGGFTKTSVTDFEGKGLLSDGRDLASVSDIFAEHTGYCIRSIDSHGKVSEHEYLDGVKTKTTFTVVERTLSEDGTIMQSGELTRTEKTEYGKKREPVKEIYPDGSTESYTYEDDDSDGIEALDEDLVTRELVKDADGQVVEDNVYEYDEKGNEIFSYDAVEDETTISTYTENSDILTEKEYAGRGSDGTLISSVTYSYEDLPDGGFKETSEDITDGITTVSSVTYDAVGRQVKESISTDGVTEQEKEITYDGFGNVIRTVTSEMGTSTTVTAGYDLNGNLLTQSTVTEDDQSDNTDIVTSTYSYDDLGRNIHERYDDNGEVTNIDTEYSYSDVTVKDIKDAGGRLIENASRVRVKEDGNLIQETFTDHEGNTVRKKEDGIYTDTIYDDYGTILGSYEAGSDPQSENGILTISLTDRNGCVTHVIQNPEDAGGYYIAGEESIVNENVYDAQSRIISKKDGEGRSCNYGYDSKGDLSSVTLPGGEKTKYEIREGKEGNSYIATAITEDARGNMSLAKTDEAGNVIETRDIDKDDEDNILYTKNTYDKRGRLTKSTDSGGNEICYEYDRKDRVKKKVSKSSGTQKGFSTYSYDINGNVTSTKDYEVTEDGQILIRAKRLRYDPQGRIKTYSEIDDPDPDMTDERINEEFIQNAIEFEYNRDGNVKEIDYAFKEGDVRGLVFCYDSEKRLERIKAKRSIGSETVRTYGYDDFGRISLIRDYYSFAKALSSDHIERSYTYDDLGRLSSMVYIDSNDGNVRESYGYEYDKNGKIIKKTTTSAYMQDDEGALRERIASYTYDVNGRLTKACYEEDSETKENSYSYDAVGNRTSSVIDGIETNYVYNGLDQLKEERKSAGGLLTSKTTHTYDSSGNRIKEREETYTYSDQGQLLAGSEGTSVEENVMTYTPQNMMASLKRIRDGKTVLTQKNRYDGDGQRIRKEETRLTVNPITEEEEEETEVKSYYYQGDSVLYTRDEGKAISSMNLLTAAGNIISTARNVNGDSEEWYLFNKDDQGSTKSIIDDGGNRAIAYEYDEYGNITSQHGEGIDNEVGYTGQIFDESTGLYYYNARFYDPETGSFTTQDTYRGDGTEPTTLNYYTYCAGDPVNYTDPTGHSFLRKAKKKAKRLKKKAKRKIKKIKKKASKAIARVKKAVKKSAKNARRAVRNKYGQAKEYVNRKRKQAKEACKKTKSRGSAGKGKNTVKKIIKSATKNMFSPSVPITPCGVMATAVKYKVISEITAINTVLAVGKKGGNLTYSSTIYGTGAIFGGVGANLGYAVGSDGSFALITTGTTTLGAESGLSVGCSSAFYNAPNVEELNGHSASVAAGYSSTAGPAISVEGEKLYSNSRPKFDGVVLNIGVGVGTPIINHLSGSYTKVWTLR